jgi:hypothetical protein
MNVQKHLITYRKCLYEKQETQKYSTGMPNMKRVSNMQEF